MHEGKLVFAQLAAHLPLTTFRRCVARYNGEHKVKRFSCLDQFLIMAFAQLTFRESLRDIEACLRAQASKLYHMGIRGGVARNTLANANAIRNWRIYADFAQHLIGIARRLYAHEPLGVPDTGKRVIVLTNHMQLPALTICDLYRLRWQVELFFKWIKQHLRIKAFFGTSENAVKSQIWIAVCTYLLVAIVRKRLNVQASMHEILQIVSLTLFEKTPLDELLTFNVPGPHSLDFSKQLNLLD